MIHFKNLWNRFNRLCATRSTPLLHGFLLTSVFVGTCFSGSCQSKFDKAILVQNISQQLFPDFEGVSLLVTDDKLKINNIDSVLATFKNFNLPGFNLKNSSEIDLKGLENSSELAKTSTQEKLQDYSQKAKDIDSMVNAFTDLYVMEQGYDSSDELFEIYDSLYFQQVDSIQRSVSQTTVPRFIYSLSPVYVIDDQFILLQYVESDIRRYWAEKKRCFALFSIEEGNNVLLLEESCKMP